MWDITIIFSKPRVSVWTHLTYASGGRRSRIPEPNDSISTSGDETARLTQVIQACDALVSVGENGFDSQASGVTTSQGVIG